MTLEIERKFLVEGDFRPFAASASHIVQGYICAERGRTVRVRLRDEAGFLTIKGPSTDDGLSRSEFEYPVSADDARALLRLCQGGIIDKTRWLVPMADGHTFEVDEFHGANDGLVMAEVELGSETEAFEKPDFLGPEVTGDKHFYNSYMLANPYSAWKQLVPEEYR